MTEKEAVGSADTQKAKSKKMRKSSEIKLDQCYDLLQMEQQTEPLECNRVCI